MTAAKVHAKSRKAKQEATGLHKKEMSILMRKESFAELKLQAYSNGFLTGRFIGKAIEEKLERDSK